MLSLSFFWGREGEESACNNYINILYYGDIKYPLETLEPSYSLKQMILQLQYMLFS